MRLRALAAMGAVCVQLGLAQKAAPGSRAEQIIQGLDMHVLPQQSGFIGVIGRAQPDLALGKRAFAVQSQNYYLLTSALPISYLHRTEPSETFVLIEGGPVDVYVFCTDGHVSHDVLGLDLSADEAPVDVIDPGCWKSLVLRPGADYALMADTYSPEFTTDRVHFGEGPAWVARFAGKAAWATPERLRQLIGPNWRP